MTKLRDNIGNFSNAPKKRKLHM